MNVRFILNACRSEPLQRNLVLLRTERPTTALWNIFCLRPVTYIASVTLYLYLRREQKIGDFGARLVAEA